MVFDVIGAIVVFLSFALPVYAAWFWISWYRIERHEGALWRRVIGFVAATSATCAIGWHFVFPKILHQHYLRVGSEDDAWWQLSLLSIKIGVWASLGGLVLGVVCRGRTRIFSTLSSLIMVVTYLVLFTIRRSGKGQSDFSDWPLFYAGNYLLSHTLSRAVPSAQRGLTSVFGMGTGGTPAVRSPTTCSRQPSAVSHQLNLSCGDLLRRWAANL